MKADSIIILIVGVVIGFGMGMYIYGGDEVEQVEQALNVLETRNVENLDFFQIDYDAALTWLEDSDTDLNEDAQSAFALVGEIGATADFLRSAHDQPEAMSIVLETVYVTLSRQTGAGSDSAIRVCLALDSDPYSADGPGLYIYAEVDDALSDEMPKEDAGWRELVDYREPGMDWAAQCYDPQNITGEATPEPDAAAGES